MEQEKQIVEAKPARRLLRPLFGSAIPPIPDDPGLYPEPSANLFSQWTFSWIYPLLKVS